MNRVKVDGMTFPSAVSASKWLGFDRSYLCRALSQGQATIVDKAGKVHDVRYVDRKIVLCPCCGKAL